MLTNADAQQFGQLRARIETMFSEPAMIVITSAAHGDGKTATSFGLAQALAETDCRVLYVDANVDSPTLSRSHVVPPTHVDYANICRYAKTVPGQRFLGLSFADKRLEAGMSMEKARAAAGDMRSRFDFIVVDTSPLLRSELAVLFAAIGEGTLLTLRLGRFPSGSDTVTINSLARVGANVLGALTVTPSMIKNFALQRLEFTQQSLLPARPMTTRHLLEPESVKDIVEPSATNAAS